MITLEGTETRILVEQTTVSIRGDSAHQWAVSTPPS